MSMARSAKMEFLRSNSAFLLKEALTFIERKAPEEATGYAYFDAAWRYRRMAICELLLEGRSDRFFALLCKSAQIQQHLQRLARERTGVEPIHLCASMSQMPVNALVSGFLDLAEAMAQCMPEHPLSGVEYEDDFLFYRFQGVLLLRIRGATELALPPLLDRWTEVVSGGEDPYLDVCRALAAQDGVVFGQAFDALVEHRLEQCARIRRTSGPDDEQYLAEAFVFMKGLALLRLADLLGMKTRSEYPLIPRFIRFPPERLAFSSSSWRIPEQGIPR
ncbi:hypothetical protein F0U59_24965 [Archangium gephyra]|nr:hypothetical protein F0U59_24965 [Archangium gephyra]